LPEAAVKLLSVIFSLLFVLAACAPGPSSHGPVFGHRAADDPPPANLPQKLEAEADAGETDLVVRLHGAAARGDAREVRGLVTGHVVTEAEAVHGSLDEWMLLLATHELELGIIYTREGAGGRFLTAEARGPGGILTLGFFIVREAGALKVDNVLSAQPVIPGVTPALASSRANILRAFWAYFAALRGVAPEFLPDRAAEAPEISRRLRLAAWRSSVAPTLRRRLVEAGPEHARNSVPLYLEAMGELLADYHLPEVRQADLQGGRAVLLFTPTEIAREARGREPFMLEYTSGWRHGMQVLVTESLYSGKK
jgi:hypothetical protein